MTEPSYRPAPPPPPAPPGAGAPDLQFDRAEPAAPASPASIAGFGPPPTAPATACAACGRPITDHYFEAGGKLVCPQCQQLILASRTGGSGGMARFLKATAYGLGAGLVGAAIWWAVGFLAQIGLVAILVGFMVGGAVRAGSDRRGGAGYQILAVVLTYLCITAAYFARYMTFFLSAPNRDEYSTLVVVMEAIIRAFIHPFARGASGIFGLVIIGFALWEAWQLNRRQQIVFNGPYRVAGASGTTGAVAAYPPPPPMYPTGGA